MWQVLFHPAAAAELELLPVRERVALLHAVEKLQVLGPRLPFPHQSDVKGTQDLRELRPRAGRSPWRAIYRRIGDVLIVAAVCPEAENDRRGFERALTVAHLRLTEFESEGELP